MYICICTCVPRTIKMCVRICVLYRVYVHICIALNCMPELPEINLKLERHWGEF